MNMYLAMSMKETLDKQRDLFGALYIRPVAQYVRPHRQRHQILAWLASTAVTLKVVIHFKV